MNNLYPPVIGNQHATIKYFCHQLSIGSYIKRESVIKISFSPKWQYVMFCAIWYHLYNLNNVKNNHDVVLHLAKLQALACNFTKSNSPPWVFFTLLNRAAHHLCNPSEVRIKNETMDFLGLPFNIANKEPVFIILS